MFLNLIDKNGNEETIFNFYDDELKKKFFSKCDELNKIGLMPCESYTYKPTYSIPTELYDKAVKIIYGVDQEC